MMKKLLSFLIVSIIFLAIPPSVNAQNVYENIAQKTIYSLLDELANDGIIQLSSVVKPYTRSFIASKLLEASTNEKLTKRQKAEIDFFLKDYEIDLTAKTPNPVFFDVLKDKPNISISVNPPGLHYNDSFFKLSARPVIGFDYFKNNNGSVYQRYSGLKVFADISDKVSIYASLVDHNESNMLAKESFLTQRQGANYKKNIHNSGRNDFSEMQGGIMYNWKWGALGLVKDQIEWGNNYNGSIIFSGRTPSFAQIKLQLNPTDWFKFNYIHGWLVSEVLDSSRSYYDSQNIYRGVFHDKYLAANMFTITPFKKVDVSLGNSIVYSDIGVQPAYLIPVMFFKSIDHTLNSTGNNRGQNAQMFFDLSTRLIPHTHIFATVFVDEIKLSTMFDKANHRNHISFKTGFKTNNIIPNVSLIGEYTRNNPWAYRHYISTTTFTSNTYNLGHYLRDNSEHYYVALAYQPLRGLKIMCSYSKAHKGEEYAYGSIATTATPFLYHIIWKNETYSLNVNYMLYNNFRFFANFMYSKIDDTKGNYTPDFFKGTNKTINFGVGIGL